MSAELQPSRACLDLVKTFEGHRRAAAQLPDGGWTVGYGHTASARGGAEVSEADAEALLTYDLRKVAGSLRALVFAPLSQNQFDALVAFAFNVGLDNVSRSTVLKRLNEGDHLGAAHALERWRQAEWQGEAQVIDALVRRRAAEKALFLTPEDGFPHAPTPLLRPLYDGREGDPIDARAGRATEVSAPLDGPLVPPPAPSPKPAEHVERLERPATLAAADALSARLRDIAVDPFTPPETTAPLATPARVEGAEQEPGPFPVADEPVMEAPPPPAPPPLPPLFTEPVEPAAPPFPGEEAVAPFPHALSPPPPSAMPSEAVVASALPHAGFPEEAKPAAQGPAIRFSALIGVVGLLLFGAALASMMATRATAVNLAAGLIGVFALAYAGAELVLPWLNRSRPSRD